MATAELAVVLPALLLIIAAGLSMISIMLAQVQCVDAAREGARAAARGEGPAEVRTVAVRSAPAAAWVDVGASGDDVQVIVSARAGRIGGLLPTFRVTASAVAVREPEASGVP